MTGNRGLVRVTAVVVGVLGLVIGVLALLEGYRIGVVADETGTVGSVPPVLFVAAVAGPVLVLCAVVQLLATREGRTGVAPR
ncbi:hypothetical protein [Cellulomonas phragmiteti]|uniref:Uncharacterized protein n=1 Tax=Cellulomonas phragmiteti TaxID=478780 RepID=A0ABQ4DQU3_9CELL|nr:hypothetical protein [Cellulomonas phragmiteti]GIG41720.1 hypothetical protein Cph01nite_34820 [Cellulomonas phragmiteti]